MIVKGKYIYLKNKKNISMNNKKESKNMLFKKNQNKNKLFKKCKHYLFIFR